MWSGSRVLPGLVLIAGLSACSPGDSPRDEPPGGLAQVAIPAGFDFATTRSVPIELTSSLNTSVRLELALPDGTVLHRGGLAQGGVFAKTLMLPTAASELKLVVSDGTTTTTTLVPVTAAGVRHEL